MQKISRARGERMFSLFTPLDERLAGEHIGDRVLTAVMMNACLRFGFDQKSASPNRGLNSQVRRDSGETQRAWRLKSSGAELIGVNNADRERFVFIHTDYDVILLEKLQLDGRAECTISGRWEFILYLANIRQSGVYFVGADPCHRDVLAPPQEI
jgi:hypothetical protein